MKWILKAALIGVGIYCAPLAAEETRPDRNQQPPSVIPADMDPCRYFTPDEPMVSFSLEMEHEGKVVPMRVPRRYMERSPLGEGSTTRGMFISGFEVHSFEPLPRGELSRRNREGLPWDWMNFLVHDVLPLDHTAGLQLLRKDIPFGDPRRIEQRLNPPHPRDLPSRPAAFGLTEVLRGANRGLGVTEGRDMFVHYSENNELEGWLVCSTAGVRGTLNAGCQHHFRSNGLDVKASYLRTELSSWQIIHANIDRFLTCAISSAL